MFFNINTVNAAQIVDLNGNQSALGLTFNSTGTVLIQGGTNNAASILTLGSDGMLFNPGAGVATFSAGIVLGAAQLWNNNSSVQVQGKTANAIYTQNFANLTLNAGQSFLFASRSSGDRCNFNFTGTFTRAIGGPLDIPTFDVTRNVVGSAAGVAGKFLSNGAAYVTLNGFTDWGGKPTAAAGNIQPVTYTSATTNVLAGNANFVAGVTNTTLALDTTITTLRDAVNQATVIDLGTHILTTGGVLMTSTVSNVAGSTFDMTDNGIGIFNLFQGATFNPAGLTIGGAALPAPIFKLELGDSATGADQLIVSRNAVLGSNGATINILPLAGDTSLTPGNYTSRLQH